MNNAPSKPGIKQLAEHGQWDFEVAERFRRRGEIRVRYPHRRQKIVEVARSLAPDKRPPFYNAEIAGHAFLPHLREKFAEICDARLELRGVRRRIDPRSHEALGIQKEPEIHLGTRAAALERAGVPTWAGRHNAVTSRQYAAKADLSRVETSVAKWRLQQNTLGKATGRSRDGAALLRERAEVLDEIQRTTELFWENGRLRDQARSRAEQTRSHCAMLLSGDGGGDRHRAAMEKRLREAEEHLTKVEAALAAGQAGLDAALTGLATCICAALRSMTGSRC